MANISLLILLISFSIFYIFLLDSLKDNHISKDLLFFIFTNIMLIFFLSIFYYYFQNINVSFIISFLLTINNVLMLREIFLIHHRFFVVSIPYLIYFLYVFILLFIKLF